MEKKYTRPAIFKVVRVEQEYDTITASVVDNVSGIETGGQDVGGFFDDSNPGSTFNHDWGD